MSAFSATLHHRPTQEKESVTVHLNPGVLRIQRSNQYVEWLPGDLTSARLLDDDSCILQNGDLFLEVMDPAFAEALERSFGNTRLFRRSFFDKTGVAGCLLTLLLFILPLWGAYLWVVPFVAERSAKSVSPETERQIGDGWFRSLTATYAIDTPATRLVQRFYDALGFGGNYPIRVTVVHEPVVNAFAIPGGHIVVFDSIIGLMDAPEQLAGLLAHEASHIQLRHSTRAVFRELANNLFFSLILGNYGDLSAIVAQNGDRLAGLSYSRQLELEADEHGLALMSQHGVPLRGMPDLFRKMEATIGKAASAPTFLSTHPALQERIRQAEAHIDSVRNPVDSVSAALQTIWGKMH